jgi:hypothetical protein
VGLNDVEKREILRPPSLELRPCGRPGHSQSLHDCANTAPSQTSHRIKKCIYIFMEVYLLESVSSVLYFNESSAFNSL